MSTSPMPDGMGGPNTNNVANDFRTAFVSGDPSEYATAMNQQTAMQVPLGSQLSLLTAQNAGNQYVNGARLQDQKLGSLQNVKTGYNTLVFPQTAGYASFSSAYGM
jgi:hypothetical protein